MTTVSRTEDNRIQITDGDAVIVLELTQASQLAGKLMAEVMTATLHQATAPPSSPPRIAED